MKRALFRADASASIGGGHVMRCLTLADELAARGWECAFASNADASLTIPTLAKSRHRRILPEEWRDPVDLLIVDNHGLDRRYESQARSLARRIAVIDDLADRSHDCDLLLDQNFGREPADYSKLVPAHCKVLTGPRFTLLRPQFATAREESLRRRDAGNGRIKNILISFGSTDPENMTERVLKSFDKVSDGLQIVVVIGQNTPFADVIEAQVARMNRETSHDITLCQAVEDMASLMARADLSVGAGGSTSWERCCLGLPTLVFEIAGNQAKMAYELDRAGVVMFLGLEQDWDETRFLDTFQNLKCASESIMGVSAKCRTVCDGFGTKRLCDLIVEMCTESL